MPAKPTPPPEKTVEALLNELEQVQAQKAELEKKEQELKTTVRKKLEQQAERLNKLGVTPAPAKPAQPDRVGRIIIEGNTQTPDKKILDALTFQPGQALQYPRLEDARVKLQKVGFRSVSVEVVPNDLDDTVFKDIRVRVEE
ncbi:POTRA domain-containing protein [Frigoriglobus tundricola]|uniref:POTRA domain-containing protein n=1 Tax=Frigoriglobus tundricola TaxID=2774151 RepID=UPI00148EE18A|nr:POTRA domain-containing protein [Frigoriglobus tundricola]